MTTIELIYLALIVCYLVEVSGLKRVVQRATGKAELLPITSVTAMTFIVCTLAIIISGVWTFALQAFVCLLSALSFTICHLFILITKALKIWFTRTKNLKS